MSSSRTSGMMKAVMRNSLAVLGIVSVVTFFCCTVAYATPKASDVDDASEASEETVSVDPETQEQADIAKSEMVYGLLAGDGSLKEMYVVNRFVSNKPGKAEDFGAYTQVANLSTTQKLVFEDDTVKLDIEDEPFFYQGILENAKLPWDVSLTYTLDGEPKAPEDLAGSSGLLEIEIQTKANEEVNQAYYDSFMMQITFTLDGALCSDIKADGATMAASGKDQTVAFTVLPGHDGSFRLSALVKDFEMASVQIAALPYSSVIEKPDTSELESGLGDLSYAVSQLNAGTSELANGVAQLSSGAESLADGVGEFGEGLAQLASSSSQIVGASQQIDDVLAQIADALDGVDLSGIDDMQQYSPVLRDIADTMSSLKSVIQGLDDGYRRIAQVMDYMAMVIYMNPISDSEIAAMREEVADDEVAAAALEKLLTTYYSIQAAIEEYYASGGSPETIAVQLEELFADGGEIDQAINALYGAADFLDKGGIDQLKQLVTGLSELSHGYSRFHAGLVEYTQGVQTLSENYGALSSGMSELADGTSQLADGASQLSGGIGQLNAATSTLPEQMRERMDEMMADYEFPEFEPVSFVDERNKNVTAVQFVMLTEAIEKAAAEPAQKEPKPEQTIVDRFMALIGM